MMMNTDRRKSLHNQTVAETARRYESEGYAVAAGKDVEKLPDFLGDYTPDLIAQHASESVIIEVRDRSRLTEDRDLKLLASLLQRQPGWRLDLVFFDEEANKGEPQSDGREPNAGEIQSWAEQAEQFLSAGQWEPAHMVAWSATEAVIRELARELETANDRDPLSMLTALAFEGTISQDEYSTIRNALTQRNALAHGRVLPPNMNATRELLRFIAGHMPSLMSV
jgi:hypothetical protein